MAKKRRVKNPVAKHMEAFNRPATHKDKTKYRRKDKHTKGSKDPFYLISILMQIFYRNKSTTGNAWWPLDPTETALSFLTGTHYKIDGKIYTADTDEFRADLVMACLRCRD